MQGRSARAGPWRDRPGHGIRFSGIRLLDSPGIVRSFARASFSKFSAHAGMVLKNGLVRAPSCDGRTDSTDEARSAYREWTQVQRQRHRATDRDDRRRRRRCPVPWNS